MTKNSELNRAIETLLNECKAIKRAQDVLKNEIESHPYNKAKLAKQIESAEKQKEEEFMREGIVIRLIDEMIAQNVVNNITFCDIVLDLMRVPQDSGYEFENITALFKVSSWAY